MTGMIRCECCAKEMDVHAEAVVVIIVKVYTPQPAEPTHMLQVLEREADTVKESKRITVCTRCYAKRRPMMWGELWAIAGM